MINKDLLSGFRLEMRSLGVWVPKKEQVMAQPATSSSSSLAATPTRVGVLVAAVDSATAPEDQS